MPSSLAALSSSNPPSSHKSNILNTALAIALLVCTAAILALAGTKVIKNRSLARLDQPAVEDLVETGEEAVPLDSADNLHWSPYMSVYLTLLLSLLLCVMFFLLIIFECHSWVSLPAVIIALIVICTAPHPPNNHHYPLKAMKSQSSSGFWPELEEIGTVCAFLYAAALLAATVSTLCCR